MPSGVYKRRPRKEYARARMAKRYTIDFCREMLEADPLGCTRLFLLSQEAPVLKNRVDPRAPKVKAASA